MYDNEIRKLKNLVDDEVWELLVNHNAIIAGGAITSVFCNREVNDIDVYFRSEEDFISFIDDVYETNYRLIANNMTSRSILFRDGRTGQDVQAIIYKWHNDVQSIFNDYDFTINMGALEFVDGKPQIVLHDEFLKHNSQRYLQFNDNTTYPLISALRVQKYVERGYKISKAQMLRILLSITNMNINSWKDLKDHVGGFYGMNMDAVFPEKDDFSMDKALTILDEVYSDNVFHTPTESLPKNDIIDTIIKSTMSEAELEVREVADGRWFKWVLEKDGQCVSHHNTEFIYLKEGESTAIVNGGPRGLWVENGWDVLTNSFATGGDYILELTGGVKSTNTYSWDNATQLVGDVQVVGKYTRAEFIRKFKRGEEVKIDQVDDFI